MNLVKREVHLYKLLSLTPKYFRFLSELADLPHIKEDKIDYRVLELKARVAIAFADKFLPSRHEAITYTKQDFVIRRTQDGILVETAPQTVGNLSPP